MTRRTDNPFLRYGLDPAEDLGAITERLRELAEDARDPEERDAIRAAWEALTKSPMQRFELALDVGPSAPPLRAVPRAMSPATSSSEPFAPRLADLLAARSLAPRLGAATVEEQRLLRVDLGFLVSDDEVRATGPTGSASEKGTKR